MDNLVNIPEVVTAKQHYDVTNPDYVCKWMVVAAEFAKAKLFADIDSPAKAFAIMQYGMEIGLSPMLALKNINIIKGQPTINTQAMLSLAAQRGVTWDVEEESEKKCVIVFKKGGRSYRSEFTLKDADDLGLTSRDQWKKQPKTMLFWRSVSNGIRRIDPGAILGLYTPEEVESLAEPADTKKGKSKSTNTNVEAAVVANDNGKEETKEQVEPLDTLCDAVLEKKEEILKAIKRDKARDEEIKGMVKEIYQKHFKGNYTKIPADEKQWEILIGLFEKEYA